MPQRIATDAGATLYGRADIERGRQVWQSTGGQQLGSIWGHGGYVAPDWSADWLHREATALLEIWAQREFQRAIIEAVSKVTHIAPPDERNQIIGSPVVAHGVIEYPLRELGLCAGISGAKYTTTTEVYPDSPRASPAQCNAAQVAAACAGIEFALSSVDEGSA